MAKRINKPLAIKRFIEGDALALAFIMEALTQYAVDQLNSPDWEGTPIINQDAWRATAQAALELVSD